MNTTQMSTIETLAAYTEWLNNRGYMIPKYDPAGPMDSETQTALAEEFVTQWEIDSERPTLAGRVWVRLRKVLETVNSRTRDLAKEPEDNPDSPDLAADKT